MSLARRLVPDLVLMDIRMPGTNGLEANRQIAADAALSEVKILVLTTFELDEYVFEALRSGASGFLVKDVELDDLVRGIRAVAAGTGKTHLSRAMMKLHARDRAQLVVIAFESGLVRPGWLA